MLNLFRAFLPKEERFFELFARHAKTVEQGALALQGVLKGGDETPVFCQRVNQFENDADNITREVLTAVRRTFITPFDRGDIKNLITAMDDAIEGCGTTEAGTANQPTGTEPFVMRRGGVRRQRQEHDEHHDGHEDQAPGKLGHTGGPKG